jgi:hypothetical protein
MGEDLFQLELESLDFFIITIHLDMIASGNNLQFGKTALNKLELAVRWTEKLQLVDIRKDDFFLCQALIAFLISLRNE